ncbi:DUF1405 domain-containing protein [Paenibacillus arenilitoris]|uniref:DUF1405 domain-containing protein n=1 Tax=Paenibacillus arenilitoris TaxID=2772299 RepID=A0A927CM09_9BACL|nr:DUF1405 domain-containing protein [Paenibacillus arenilitoris]MBD2869682.1 DUF1405 domain-containing protein [Paenibacillus arenilitoris]
MLSAFWSRDFLLNRSFLWLLFIVNLLGTIYGYIWYEGQLADTLQHHPLWRIVFVPDSPTASLFFTLTLLYWLFPPRDPNRVAAAGRSVIEALGVVCSVKYGIWAVAMIVAGAWQGAELHWQHYMLMASHLGMAFEALLYYRFMRAGIAALLVGTGWLLLNDTVDYTFGIFPYLADELDDDLPAVRSFTYGLSIFSFAAAWLVWRFRKQA